MALLKRFANHSFWQTSFQTIALMVSSFHFPENPIFKKKINRTEF